MREHGRTRRDTRRVRAFTLLGGLALEAVVFAALLAAAPATRQGVESPLVPADITCDLYQPPVDAV